MMLKGDPRAIAHGGSYFGCESREIYDSWWTKAMEKEKRFGDLTCKVMS